MVGLETVIHLDHEGVVQLRADILLILHDVFLLVLADELLQHHLHRVELPVLETADQVHLAEPSYRQALADLVLLQPALAHELHAVETHLLRLQSPLTDRYPVIQQQVPMRRFEPDHKCSLKHRIGISIVSEVAVDVLVEEERQVLGLDADGQSHLEGRRLVVEGD